LKVFEYRVLRRIFGSSNEQVARYWYKLHNEKLHYAGKMSCAGHGARMGEMNIQVKEFIIQIDIVWIVASCGVAVG
jgi:hypothetical protein